MVGAERGDTASSQFWIEQDRLLFVRLIEARKNPKQPEAPANLLDVTFEKYQRLGQGWVAPRSGDQGERQGGPAREVSRHPADVPLQPDLYDTETYHKAEWIGTR